MKFAISLALFAAAAPCLADPAPGVAQLRDMSSADRPLSLSVWYPSPEPGSALFGGNPVFEGAPFAPDAPLPDGMLPLVVMSHGGLRSADDSGAWLASAIAREGFVVVEVNAPRPDDAAAALSEIWRRPQDLRRAIDLMLSDDTWGPRIDPGKVAVGGVALGATAALLAAGADLDAARYMRSCADGGAPGPDCGWYAAQGVDMSRTSPEGLAGLTPDPRVAAVFAVNAEYLSALGAPPAGVGALLVSFGTPAAPADTSNARSVTLPDATVFDAFALCTDAGPDILTEEEGDATLCGESADARRTIHREASEAIASFLEDRLD